MRLISSQIVLLISIAWANDPLKVSAQGFAGLMPAREVKHAPRLYALLTNKIQDRQGGRRRLLFAGHAGLVGDDDQRRHKQRQIKRDLTTPENV